ncbi:MAG: hypothetical protein QMD14_02630 [Candidatus Aenigmarchaeota archaeon]|nr:hypothetical protein [Candidatus Aenigmarchaeota archaeon]
MEIVLHVEKHNYHKVREVLLKDPVISLASITFREAKALTGKDGYYCVISGIEEQCKKAMEAAKDLAKEVEKEEKDKVINKIKEEEEAAKKGFGAIIG